MLTAACADQDAPGNDVRLGGRIRTTKADEPCPAVEVPPEEDLSVSAALLATDPDGNRFSLDIGFGETFIQIAQLPFTGPEAQQLCFMSGIRMDGDDVVRVGVPTEEGIIDAEWLPDGGATLLTIQPLAHPDWWMTVLVLPIQGSSTRSLDLDSSWWVQ